MNVKTEQAGGISIVRVGETRLMYPILSDFATAVNGLLAAGRREILIDLTPVTYVDSATIGCLMDLYRQVHSAGGHLKLSGVQKRVETEDMVKEIDHLIEQMDDGERRAYLAESLFLNTVKYENDKLEAYMKRLTKK